ncbi:Dyp-type peroxidase domain-containing protein [Wenjunlia vitaminophila]|uniref:Dyp-type peroxidase domain-containing protein n=1 Tax=Wenjunlia vitaminophila TaxID=76728 RepID=UPI000AC72A01
MGSASVPFHGRHQAGISSRCRRTATWSRSTWCRGRADGPAALMRRWTSAAATMARAASPRGQPDRAGRGPSSLTVTFGFGASFFDRTGLRSQRPEALAPLPRSADALDRQRSDGDLFVQVGATTPGCLPRPAGSPEARGRHRRGPLADVRFNRTPGPPPSPGRPAT